ncbi:MAG: glycosyltransferase family 4 protein [Fusobacteriaceae bacterium]
MKIYLDNIVFSKQDSAGISVYWKEISNRILNDKSHSANIVEQEINSKNIFRSEMKIPKEIIKYENRLPLWLYKFLPLTLKIEENSIFHSSYYRVSYSRKVKNIVTVHDFTHEYFFPLHKKFLNYWKKKLAIMKADGIICISQNTKKDLLKFHPWAKNKKIKVIYNGVGDQFFPINGIEKEKNILFVGSRVSYKNFNMAVDVLKELKSYNLVIIGGGKLSDDEKKNLEKKIPGRYVHKTGISSENLNLEFNKAFAFIYPSSYEGFGIPILESMKAGCPVITTNKSSIPEVADNAALLVKEIKSEEFLEKIIYLKNQENRNEIIEKGIKHSTKFSWETTYLETISFYQEILDL